MTDILSTYLPNKNNSSSRETSSNSKTINSKYGLNLPNNNIILKLPKISLNTCILKDNNNVNIELTTNKKQKEKKFLNFSKINYDRMQLFKQNKKAKSKKALSKIIFKNQILSELNQSTKSSKNNNENNYSYQKNISTLNPILLKENINNFKSNNILNYNDNNSNYKNSQIQNTDRNKKIGKKEVIIKEYVNNLLKFDNQKNKLKYALFNKKKLEKYSKDKSIDPAKYIKNMFLDESYDSNAFKTTKIQLDCFNGNEILRNENIKKINKNKMNSLNIDSLKIESNDSLTKSLIDKMLKSQEKLNNFYFGKKYYTPKINRIKNNSNIKNYLKLRRIEKEKQSKDFVWKLEDKIKIVMQETKDTENSFIERHKSRGKIMRKIRQFCDNYEGIVRRASIFDKMKK